MTKLGQSKSNGRGRSISTGIAIVLFIITAVVFGSTIAGHMRNARNPLVFNDDSRAHIPPLLNYTPDGPFRGDYLAEYHLAMTPLMFRGVYAAAAWLGIDPRVLAKVLPYPLFLTTLFGVAAAAWRIGGPIAAWGSMLLCLASDVFLSRITGGLARGFAFPLLTLAIVALTYGRPYMLASITVLAAAFYPPVSVVIGLMLFGLMILPAHFRGSAGNWPVRKRMILIVTTALLTFLATAPVALGLRSYGPLLTRADVVEFPESGERGRYGSEDLIDAANLWLDPVRTLGTGIFGFEWWKNSWAQSEGRFVLGGLIIALCFGGFVKLWMSRDEATRRVLLTPILAAISYYLSFSVFPHLYLPQRHLAYCLPLFTVILAPAAVNAYAGFFGDFRNARIQIAGAILTIIACLACVATFGARDISEAGYRVRINESDERELLEFIHALPEPALIAGWPAGIMDTVPLVTAKPVLLNFEMHQVFHRHYVIETRERAAAIFTAYFSPDTGPIHELGRRWGVTHLVVDRSHFNEPPAYFAPFNRQIQEAVEQPGTPRRILLNADPKWVIYDDGRYLIIELDRIDNSE